MELAFGLGMLVGLGTTVALMYAILRKYTYPAVEQPFFSDPTLFGLFAVGLVAGTVVFVVSTYYPLSDMIYAVLFSILETVILLVVLNLKRFHGKSDTVFYGFGLGLGLGGAMASGLVYMMATLSQYIDAVTFVFVCVMAVTQVAILGAVGTMVGEGIARLRPWEFLAQAILVNTVYMLMLSLAESSISSGSYMAYVGLAGMVVFSFWMFYRTMVTNLSRVVGEVLRMEGRKRDDLPPL